MQILVKLPWLTKPVKMTAEALKHEAVRIRAIGKIASYKAGSKPYRATFSGSEGNGFVSVIQDSTGTRLHYMTHDDDEVWRERGGDSRLDIGEPIDCPPVVSKQWIKAAANMRRLAARDSLQGLEKLSSDPLEWKIPVIKRGPRQLTLEIEAFRSAGIKPTSHLG